MADVLGSHPSLDVGANAPEVVITGMGLVTPLGASVETTWRAVRDGAIGLRDWAGPDSAMEQALPAGSTLGQAVATAGNAENNAASGEPHVPREAALLRNAIQQALQHARVDTGPPYARRTLAMGTTLHGLRAGGRWLRTHNDRELRVFLAGGTSALAAHGQGLEGGSFTTCSACSSSLGAIALGVTLLRAGLADLVVAGGYDAISEYAWGGFNALRLVAPGAVRPFCAGRQGMKLAEGYAALVLERVDDAAHRGVEALACVAGWGESADAHHLTQPHPQGEGAARAMRDALSRAGLGPDRVGLIAAHATATPDNDASEARAIATVFGDASDGARPAVVGFKSHLGHTLGGAGAVELCLSVMALREQIVPPTAGVSPGDIEFPDLNVACGTPRSARIDATLNTSLGFGGANTCVVLTRHAPPPRDTQGQRVTAHLPAPGPFASVSPDLAPVITGVGVVMPASVLATLVGHHAQRHAPGVFGPEVLDDASLGQVINARRLRRLSAVVKHTLAASTLAVRHAGLEGDGPSLAESCAVLASTHGSPSFCADYYAQLVREGVLSANPVLFAEGVPNAAAAHVSTNLGIKGACQTIIGTRTSGLDALILACARVAAGDVPRALVVAAEEAHPTVARGYACLRGMVPTGLGAVALLIEPAGIARARGASVLARVEGAGWASVPPTRLGGGAARALKHAMTRPTHPQRPEVPLDAAWVRTGTWLDRAAQSACKRAGIASLNTAPSAELFSAAGLALVARRALAGSGRGLVLTLDWTGLAAAVRVAGGAKD